MHIDNILMIQSGYILHYFSTFKLYQYANKIIYSISIYCRKIINETNFYTIKNSFLCCYKLRINTNSS